MPIFTRFINTIDSHTAGEPTRLITAGFPPIPGRTIAERWQYARENLNDVRRLLMLEPRGHGGMFGAVLLPPCRPEADHGLLFCDSGEWQAMCGHGSIGAAVTLVRMGMIQRRKPETIIRFETPCGLVTAHVETDNGAAHAAWIENVPSFLFAHGLELPTDAWGTLRVDIAFGGNFFLVVPVEQLGLTIEPHNAGQLVSIGLRLLSQANAAFRVYHPTEPHLNFIGLVEFTQPGRDGADFRNVVVFGDGNFDRSPCGSGTCARMAELHAQGRLRLGDTFVHESIVGTRFEGSLLGTTNVGEFHAVIPRVKGDAFVTGLHTFVLDPDDTLPTGFNILA